MNNIFKKSIMLFIFLGILLAPVSPVFQNKNGNLNAGIRINNARAEALIFADEDSTKVTDTSARFTIGIDDKDHSYHSASIDKGGVFYAQLLKKADYDAKNAAATLYIKEKFSVIEHQPQIEKIENEIPLTPNTEYVLILTLTKVEVSITHFFTDSDVTEFSGLKKILIPIKTSGSGESQGTIGNTEVIENQPDPIYELGCSLIDFSLGGCIAEFFYIFWEASAFIAYLAGSCLDFLVYYSTNSTSYTNGFVNNAFGAIRDIANIFFIIALLYVALKTILDLNVTNNKKLIGSIIVVALLINFSLFFTQVIIDGTNILAKVFYNQISSVDKYGKLIPSGVGEEKSISVGLVNKFNPQEIVSGAEYVASRGRFIFVTILATAITLYAAFIFFSVALLFVSRVVMLWLSMIFAPIAFASHTLPFDIPGIGHKDWWKNLLENAFLAPIFIFFLYIIVMFSGFLPEIVKYPSGADMIQKLMSTVIPFAILMVLLMKAKEMAVKFSGEMGAAVAGVGKMVGGAVVGGAVGAGLGVGAIALRGTVGRVGNAIASSAKLKDLESKGRFGIKTLRNIGKATGSGSMDIRGVKIAGKSLADTGLKVNTLGKPQEGGFTKIRADKDKKRRERAEELKVGPDEKLSENLRKVETDLQNLLRTNSHELETLDKKIKSARENSQDLSAKAKADPTGTTISPITGAVVTNIQAAKDAADKLADLKGEKKARKDAGTFTTSAGTVLNFTTNTTTGVVGGKSISTLEDVDIPHAHEEVEKENRKRTGQYSNLIKSNTNKILNMFSSFGQHSNLGADETAHKIFMDMKLDSGTKH